jgi:hypothetical protein
LKIVVVPDRNAPEDDSFGSYFVFRKLEQAVRHFKIREEQNCLAILSPCKMEEHWIDAWQSRQAAMEQNGFQRR